MNFVKHPDFYWKIVNDRDGLAVLILQSVQIAERTLLGMGGMQVVMFDTKFKLIVGFTCISMLLVACRPSPEHTAEAVPTIKQYVDNPSLESPQQADQVEQLDLEQSGESEATDDAMSGVKLIDVVNQATLPKETQRSQHSLHNQHLDYADLRAKYAGRYYGKINCETTLTSCEKGEVEYVLNLLEDGSAFRTIIQQGKIYVDEGNTTQSYRQDAWIFDPHEDDLVIHLKEGVELYFDVDEESNLRLDVNKTVNYDFENRTFFQPRLPAQYESYILRKIKEAE